jgi:hypothetical protein
MRSLTEAFASRGACIRTRMLLGCVLGSSILLSGLTLRAAPAPDDTKKEEPKKDAPRKVDPNDVDPFPPLPDVLPPGFDPEIIKRIQMDQKRIHEQMRKQMEEIRKQIEQMHQLQPGAFPNINGILPPDLQPGFAAPERRAKENRLGAALEAPTPALIEQLDLPKDQGVVLNNLKADSPASKAGLKNNDILLQLGGKAVPSNVEDFAKVLNDIKPNTPVDATVMRKGKVETIKGISLPEAPAEEKPQPEKNPGGAVPFPKLPPLIAGGGLPAGIDNSSLQMTRTPNSFTTRYSNGSGYIALSGKMQDGKAAVEEIIISTGAETKKFKSVEEVPESARDQVNKLLRMTEKGTARAAELENKAKE